MRRWTAARTWTRDLSEDSGELFACQKPFGEFCNKDELQFQVVHQVEELWMKLIAYTLLDIGGLFDRPRAHG
jgi:tryptophan 2,3-dioxygenase